MNVNLATLADDNRILTGERDYHERRAATLKLLVIALEAALKKYTHCRHGCIECNCTTDAKAALYGASSQSKGDA